MARLAQCSPDAWTRSPSLRVVLAGKVRVVGDSQKARLARGRAGPTGRGQRRREGASPRSPRQVIEISCIAPRDPNRIRPDQADVRKKPAGLIGYRNSPGSRKPGWHRAGAGTQSVIRLSRAARFWMTSPYRTTSSTTLSIAAEGLLRHQPFADVPRPPHSTSWLRN